MSEEFSCPRCRSNLYDPYSGCIVCGNKGTTTLLTTVDKPYRAKQNKSQRQLQRQQATKKSQEIFVKQGLKGLLKPGRLNIECPHCTSEVKLTNMARHLRKVHSLTISVEDKTFLGRHTQTLKQLSSTVGKASKSSNLKTNPKVEKSVVQSHSKTVYHPADQLEHTRESYRQSLYDERDASHSYAHHFRDNGQFGSHPLHDNYDDESFPD